MSLEQDVAAARTAVDEVEQACARVGGRFREGTDSRRLRRDLDLRRGAFPIPVQGRHHVPATCDDGMDDAGSPGRTTR